LNGLRVTNRLTEQRADSNERATTWPYIVIEPYGGGVVAVMTDCWVDDCSVVVIQ